MPVHAETGGRWPVLFFLSVVGALVASASAMAADARFLDNGVQDVVIWGAAERDHLELVDESADLDGDGATDLLLWSEHDRTGSGSDEGAVYILFHRTSWPTEIDLAAVSADVTILGAEGERGLRVSGTGDLDGDGRADLLVRALRGRRPIVRALLAPDVWPATIDLSVDPPDIELISSVNESWVIDAAARDLDGDGAAELMVHTHNSTQGGYTVRVWFDRADWPATIDLDTDPPDLVFSSLGNCYTIMEAAELTGDGRPDLVFADCSRSPVLLVQGRAVWPPTWDLEEDGSDASFELDDARVTTGDLTGDGQPDLIMGERFRPKNPEGQVYVFEGGPGLGAATARSEIIGRDQDDDLIPRAVGDLDGDGRPDLLVEARGSGARHRTPAAVEVSVLLGPIQPGSRELLSTPPALVVYGGNPSLTDVHLANLGGATAADLALGMRFADGPGDRTAAGRVSLMLDLELTESPPAVDLFVDATNGDDGFSGESWAEALATLTAALDALDRRLGPATIHVAEGTYVGPFDIGTATRLRGGYAPGGGDRDPASHPTVLHMDETIGSVVTFHPLSLDENSHLDGFVVRGGAADFGAGVYVGRGPGAAIITNNLIRDNTAIHTIENIPWICYDYGYGTRYEQYCGSNCAGYGTGVWLESGASAVITNNLIRDNSFETVRSPCSMASHPYCVTASICGNPSITPPGSAVGADRVASLLLQSNTVVRNSTSGVLIGTLRSEIVEVHDNILYFNENPATDISWDLHSALPDRTTHNVIGTARRDPDATNLRDDPLFVDMAADDFRLSHLETGQGETSPAVDAGSGAASGACLPDFAGEAGLCLWAMTTRTDEVRDTGTLDIGWHATLPNQPPLFDGVAAVAAEGTCALRVSWEPAEDLEGDPVRYNVYRATSSGGQDLGSPIATVEEPGLSHLDEGLTWGTEYFYVVRAEDTGGREEANVVEASATPEDREDPEFVSLVPRAMGACDVEVAFELADACSGLDTWELHRSATAGFSPGAGTLVASDPAAPFADTVPANGNFYYKLRATDAAGNTAVSGQATVRVETCDATPTPPGEAWILRTFKTAAEIGFEIAPAAGADAHRLYRGDLPSLSSSGPSHGAGLGGDGTEGTLDDVGRCRFDGASYLDPASRFGGSFYYLVVGLNDAGEGLYGTASDEQERPTGADLGTLDCN